MSELYPVILKEPPAVEGIRDCSFVNQTLFPRRALSLLFRAGAYIASDNALRGNSLRGYPNSITIIKNLANKR